MCSAEELQIRQKVKFLISRKSARRTVEGQNLDLKNQG